MTPLVPQLGSSRVLRGERGREGNTGLVQPLLSADSFCQAAGGSPVCPPQALGWGWGCCPSYSSAQCSLSLQGLLWPACPMDTACSGHTGTRTDTQMGPYHTCPRLDLPLHTSACWSGSCSQHPVWCLSGALPAGPAGMDLCSWSGAKRGPRSWDLDFRAPLLRKTEMGTDTPRLTPGRCLSLKPRRRTDRHR